MPLYRLGLKAPKLPADERYWIAPDADIIGDVTLGEDASVWFHAVIRGDNDPIVIGARTNVQDGAVLHSDDGVPLTIGDDVTIGHKAMVHSCTVGEGSLIGIGAVILGHARIGSCSIVGAGALVTEGKSFPDNSLIVGSPARAIRTLDERMSKMIAAGADIYVKRWQQYAKGLKRVG